MLVPKYANPFAMSIIALCRLFSPALSVSAPTRVKFARLTFTTLPGEVEVPKYA